VSVETIETIDNCQIEWDKDRGVLYVHSIHGHTLIRICGLDISESTGCIASGLLDITKPERVSYP
jgi:hypothetical protein